MQRNLNILIFEFMGIRIGIDMAQISEICEKEEAEEKSRNIFWIHEKIPNIINKVFYKAPKVLMVKHDGFPTGIIVDMPQEIVLLPIVLILPLPEMIEMHSGDTALWGVTIQGNNMVLLMDVLALLKSNKP